MTVLPTPRAQLAIVILLFGMELLLIFMATTFWIIGLERLAYLGEVIVVKLDLERLPYVKHWLKDETVFLGHLKLSSCLADSRDEC